MKSLRHTLIPTGCSHPVLHLTQTGARQSESASFKRLIRVMRFPLVFPLAAQCCVLFFCFVFFRSAVKIETSCLQSDADFGFRLQLIFHQMGIKTLSSVVLLHDDDALRRNISLFCHIFLFPDTTYVCISIYGSRKLLVARVNPASVRQPKKKNLFFPNMQIEKLKVMRIFTV